MNVILGPGPFNETVFTLSVPIIQLLIAFTCILSVKHSNFASFYCLHIECVSTACVSTILKMCKPVCQSCVGVSCGCLGENSVNRIKLNKGPEFSIFSHYKNLIDKLFYFVSL